MKFGQERPFSSVEEETLLNLLRTADCLQRAFQHKSRDWGVTSTQYNVLRILRGAHPQGLTCTQIGDRMITADPDITRLLARLKALKLIRQQRDRNDRRVVWTQISDQGLELLQPDGPGYSTHAEGTARAHGREGFGGAHRASGTGAPKLRG